jgi:hypothetical protein
MLDALEKKKNSPRQSAPAAAEQQRHGQLSPLEAR